MVKNRLEAFSDGVLAILITIMVLELKIPRGDSLESLTPLIPVFMSYMLSFIYLGIYWNNHHHMLHMVQRVNGGMLWANMHLLFWLSLVPFVTGWLGEYPYSAAPTACYGFIMSMSAIAYVILERTIIASQGRDSPLKSAVGKDIKGKVSLGLYLMAIPAAYIVHWVSDVIYILVALIWLIPDRRIERALEQERTRKES